MYRCLLRQFSVSLHLPVWGNHSISHSSMSSQHRLTTPLLPFPAKAATRDVSVQICSSGSQCQRSAGQCCWHCRCYACCTAGGVMRLWIASSCRC